MNLKFYQPNKWQDEGLYSVSTPLGSTSNMDGAAVTMTIFSLVATFTTGVHVTLPIAVFLSVVATFSACGTSSVAGRLVDAVPLGCSLFGISNDIAMRLVGVGFIISVIQDSLETVLNSSGDVLFTATAEFLNWKRTVGSCRCDTALPARVVSPYSPQSQRSHDGSRAGIEDERDVRNGSRLALRRENDRKQGVFGIFGLLSRHSWPPPHRRRFDFDRFKTVLCYGDRSSV